MENTRKQYVIGLTNLNNIEIELVGKNALEFEKIQQLGINIPIGFVITSTVFDDFLLANDLLDFISPLINDIDYEDLNLIKKTSSEIMQAILKASFPNILQDPILQAYGGMSGFSDAFVTITPSVINSYLDESNYAPTVVFNNISGKENLLLKVKESWAQLFTPEAISYRGQEGYEGYITLPLIVQKMQQSEVNGRIYSASLLDQNPEHIEIQAFFGLEDYSLWSELVPDSYIVSKKTEEIIEKKIVGQDWMVVRKGKSNDKNPLLKIQISKLWQKKQKLDDKYILTLARYIKQLEDTYHNSIQASWSYEAGKVSLTSFKLTDLNMSEVITKSNLLKKKQIIDAEISAEIEPQNMGSISEVAKKSIDDYVEEIHQIQGDLQISNPMVHGNKISVDIKQLEDLQMLAHGKALGEKTVFGLVHFIFTETDYQGLTGDEILILKNLDLQFISTLNACKGLVIQNLDQSEDYELLRVPCIYDVKDAFDIFQENEVITLRPWNGGIYLGAGKETETETNSALKLASTETKDTTGTEVGTSTTAQLVDEPVEVLSHKSEIDISSNVQDQTIKTLTDIWQIVTDEHDIAKTGLVDGYLLKITDMIKTYTPELYSSEIKGKMIDVMNKLGGKPVILVSAAQGKLFEEILESELEAIDRLRNKDNLRNLWLSFDHLEHPNDVINAKKILTSKGFRPSSTFKVFLTVHSPMSLITLKGLLESDLDGIILDVDRVLSDHRSIKGIDDFHIKEFVLDKIKLIHSKRTTCYVLLDQVSIAKEFLAEILAAGANCIVVNAKDLKTSKQTIAEIESTQNQYKKTKRGRKKKIVDFGF